MSDDEYTPPLDHADSSCSDTLSYTDYADSMDDTDVVDDVDRGEKIFDFDYPASTISVVKMLEMEKFNELEEQLMRQWIDDNDK